MKEFKMKFKAALLHDPDFVIEERVEYVEAETTFSALAKLYDKYHHITDVKGEEVKER